MAKQTTKPPRLSAEQKLEAIKELCGWPNVKLMMRKPGDWYLACGANIGGNGVLTMPTASSPTPFKAIEASFEQLTNLADNLYLVVHKFGGDRRFRWNGFMWSDVTDETK